MATTTTITALVALAAASRQQDDVLPIVDVHDFTQAPSGSTKKITVANLFTNVVITGTISASGNATTTGGLDVTGVTVLRGGTNRLIGTGASVSTVAAWRLGDSNSASSRDWALSNGYGPAGAAIGSLVLSRSIAANGDPLAVTGVEVLRLTSSGISVTGAIASTGALAITGALTGATTGAFSSNVTVGGTLGVTGVATFVVISASAITVSGLINAVGGMATGSTPASVGAIRISNGQGIKMRNAANTADLDLLYTVVDDVGIGDGTHGVYIGGSGGKVGFYGTTPQTLATVTGSRGGNAALAALLTALNAMGLISNATTA